MGAFRPILRAVKGYSLRRVLFWGAALASLTSLLVPPPVAMARPHAAPIPSAALSVPTQTLLGENFTFTVTFDNADPVDTGYGPYVDLYLPLSGIDGSSPAPGNDGISIVSATYGGIAAVLQTINCNAGANFTPTSDGIARVCPAAPGNYTGSAVYVWQLSILQLPFGSFVPTQPPAAISVTAALSRFADLAQNLPIRAQPGFRYGSTPTGTVPPVPLVGSATVASTSPTLLGMTKVFSGPENETATGPNFQRTYTIAVDVATGQTITNLDVSDNLSGSIQFVSVATAPASAAIATPSTVTPGGLLTRRLVSITGGAGAGDATETITFYVPDNNALGSSVVSHSSPTAGAGVPISNTANAQGSWTPLDVRDGPQTPAASATQTFTARSLAIQKTASIVSDTGPAGTSPGDTIEYALQFQVSDYFAYGNLVIPSDVLSDGQLLAATTPTLTITQNGSTTGPTNFAPANWSSTKVVAGRT
ncbi:MAG: hypothetical protein NTU91_17355, partial [Chloroflexi bacterium]|nr:hypothetical protein [Chloroflexota bacterium]